MPTQAIETAFQELMRTEQHAYKAILNRVNMTEALDQNLGAYKALVQEFRNELVRDPTLREALLETARYMLNASDTEILL